MSFSGKSPSTSSKGEKKTGGQQCPPLSHEGEVFINAETAAALKEINPEYVGIFEVAAVPRRSVLMYFNLTTLEGFDYTIELSRNGWRVTSQAHNTTAGRYSRDNLQSEYFPLITSLMCAVSEMYANAFAQELSDKLEAVKIRIGGQREDRRS